MGPVTSWARISRRLRITYTNARMLDHVWQTSWGRRPGSSGLGDGHGDDFGLRCPGARPVQVCPHDQRGTGGAGGGRGARAELRAGGHRVASMTARDQLRSPQRGLELKGVPVRVEIGRGPGEGASPWSPHIRQKENLDLRAVGAASRHLVRSARALGGGHQGPPGAHGGCRHPREAIEAGPVVSPGSDGALGSDGEDRLAPTRYRSAVSSGPTGLARRTTGRRRTLIAVVAVLLIGRLIRPG